MFTFLHTADIHLDSPLQGLDRYEGAPVNEIRGASRQALQNLVTTAIDEKVAFVIIAGDLYDGDWRDFNTGMYFVQQMVRLKQANIPVYGVTGNHDAANRITRQLPLPDNVTFFSAKEPKTVTLKEHDVALHGQSFAEQCTTADLAANYPAPMNGCFNIGVLHTSMSGREGHGNYAPCSEECLRSAGYDYWALGHIHKREVMGSSPVIAYPGNIQGRHIRETGPKGCLMVQVSRDGVPTTKFMSLDVLRWEQLQVEITSVSDKVEVLEKATAALHGALEEAEGRLLAVRVQLTGETILSESLSADIRLLTEDLRAIALDVGSGNLWIEKVKNLTNPPSEKASTEATDDGPFSEVNAVVRELGQRPNPGEDLGVDFRDLVRKLPSDLSEVVKPSDPQWWKQVLNEAEARLVARMRE